MNMDLQDVDIQTFLSLGLNSSEARVFVALYKIGTAEASRIAKASTVARPDVYRALSNLHKLGLVEKIIAHPSRFRAVPIETGVAVLLEHKTKKYIELKSESASLIRRVNKNNIHKESYQESQFVLIPSKAGLIKRLTKTIEKTQKSIDISTSWKRFKSACYRLAEPLEEAWRRGVKGRVVVEETEEPVLEFVKTYWKSPHAKIRQVRFPPKTVMALYDKKEVYIYVIPAADMTESPALWSNNPSLVAMAEDCFETLWNTAQQLSVM
jgi:sugar-specific transcriptional regulator TrmB